MILCDKCDSVIRKGKEVISDNSTLKFCSENCVDNYEKEGFGN